MSLFRNVFLLSVLFLFNFKLNGSFSLKNFSIGSGGKLQEKIHKKKKGLKNNLLENQQQIINIHKKYEIDLNNNNEINEQLKAGEFNDSCSDNSSNDIKGDSIITKKGNNNLIDQFKKIENGIPQSGLSLIKSETIPGSGIEEKNENFSIIGSNKFNKNLIKNGLEKPISLNDRDINQNGNIVVNVQCCNFECNIF